MKLLRKPVIILVNVAIAAIVGGFGYNFKHKARVASDYLDGLFGSFTREAMEKNNSNGNICIVLAIVFLGFAITGIVLYPKSKKSDSESNQPKD